MSLIAVIKVKLQVLKPQSIKIIDESHLHVGHPGNTGGSHLSLFIVSDAFKNTATLTRHRMIYQLLAEEMKQHIHALKINAKTYSEVQ